MSTRSGATDRNETVKSLLSLHHSAGTFGDAERGLLGPSPSSGIGAAISALAVTDDATPSSKLDLLRALARADFPAYDTDPEAYDALGGAVAGAYGLDVEQLLSDVKAEAGGERFASSASGAKLPHHVALGMADICQIRDVDVEGKRATWIFSEFETDASFASIAAWVKPDNWPVRGPMLFKSMKPVDGVPTTDIGGLDLDAHWHNLYMERVHLIEPISTALHCDYFETTGQAAGVTYELSFSVDDQLNVDRGFLLVTELGDVRHVKVLKVVGFTDPTWTDVARFVCPLWTDWVRSAVEDGTTTDPMPAPEGGREPGTGGPPGTGGRSEVFEEWVEFFGESAKTYTAMFGDVTGRMMQGGYRAGDAMQDTAKYWSQIAKDWAKAWAYGYETMEQMAEEGIDSIKGPPGSGTRAKLFPERTTGTTARGVGVETAGGAVETDVETTTVPIPGLDAAASLHCTDLRSIEVDGRVIPASSVRLRPVRLTKSVAGIEVRIDARNVPAGFYLGEVIIGGSIRRSVQLYVSKARSHR